MASSQVDQAQAKLDLAQSQLDNTRITSPIDGRGIRPQRGPRGAGLQRPARLRRHRREHRERRGQRSRKAWWRRSRLGQRVPVSVDAAGGVTLQGVVQTISPAADPRTQAYAVKVRIDHPGDAMRPGMFARVSFPVDRQADVLVVPNGALVSETGVDYVYAVVPGNGGTVVKKIAVQPGIADDSVTAILSGLTEGTLVVTEGQSFLNDGAPVKIPR